MSRKHRCGRGVLKFRDQLLTLPRPGEAQAAVKGRLEPPGRKPARLNGVNGSSERQKISKNEMQSTAGSTAASTTTITIDKVQSGMAYRDMRNFPTISISNDAKKPTQAPNKKRILAKYTYNANPEKPGGFKELSMKQGEKLYYLGDHKSNPHWIKAETDDGKTGYVPKSYTMLLESQSGLPWLEQKKQEEELERQERKKHIQSTGFGTPETQNAAVVKPYVSAYNKQTQGTQNAVSKYECTLCAKTFNGPLPYKMHLASKAHKEEEAMQG